MGCYLPFGFRRPPEFENVGEGQAFRQTPHAACTESAETLANGHAWRQGFTKDPPRFIGPPGKGANARKLLLRIFRSVAAPKGSNNSNDLPSEFESAIDERLIDKLSQKGVARKDDVPSWQKGMNGNFSPFSKKAR